MAIFSEIVKVEEGICQVFPPGITNFVSAIVNLPVILLWILTLPPRTFLCILSSITQLPLYGLLANLFPPLTLLCSLTTGNSLGGCNSECPGCNQSSECIEIPQSYINFCQKALPYFSIFNQIFCLVGYVILVLAIPITSIINIILVPLGKQLCLGVNPNNCIPGDNSE